MKHRPDEVDAEARVRSGDARVTRNKPDASAVSVEERIAIDACPSPYLTHGDRVCSYCLPLAEKINAAVAAERERWKRHVGFLLSATKCGEVIREGHCDRCDDLFTAIRGGDDG